MGILGWSLAAALFVAPVQGEVLTNDSVAVMVSAGLGDDVVIAKIKGTASRFTLTTDDMIALKQRGVSSAVLAAMVTAGTGSPVSSLAAMSADSPDPLVPHPSGVYLLADREAAPRMIRMDPITSNQTKTGGILGYALTGGIASLSMKSVIPGGTARVSADVSRPVFYFYFDQANQSLSNGAAGSAFVAGPAATVTSPNEFSLVRLTAKKDRREARVGSFNIAGAKTGVMDKDRIAFDYDQIAPGVFMVTPSGDLKPGQYGFLYSMTSGSGPGLATASMTARVFDFGIE